MSPGKFSFSSFLLAVSASKSKAISTGNVEYDGYVLKNGFGIRRGAGGGERAGVEAVGRAGGVAPAANHARQRAAEEEGSQ